MIGRTSTSDIQQRLMDDNENVHYGTIYGEKTNQKKKMRRREQNVADLENAKMVRGTSKSYERQSDGYGFFTAQGGMDE